ncbi:hypothetical protein [Chitinimonas naiadis]
MSTMTPDSTEGEEAISVQTVLCIPGPWQDRNTLITSLVEHSEGYLFVGMLLMNTADKSFFELEVHEPDPRMARAFAAAGPHWANTDDMARIADHRMVLYLVGEGGSREAADSIMNAASALIKAGGYGVKVESSGIAHSPSAWLTMSEQQYLFSAYRAYVLNVVSDAVYSCGMHNLGLPDAIVDADDADDPGKLVSTFCWYLVSEAPTIRSGQTFAADATSPRYRISAEPCELYEEDSLFTNPFGMWRLRRIETPSA